MTDASQSPVAQFAAFLETMKGLSAKRVGEIVAEFERHLPATGVRALLVNDARVTVETVEVYGLEIELDANGRAGRVALAGQDGSARTTLDVLNVEHW